MSRQNLALLAFNRGLVSRLGLARADIKRMALSAETMTNWMPRVLGSMMLRPGRSYLGSTDGDDAARFLPFVFSTDDKALLELTDLLLRVWVDDALVERPEVSTTLANGTFPSNLTSWTDDDEAGATSVWVSAGVVSFTGTGVNAAMRTQALTIIAADQGVEHALRIVVQRGVISLRIGSTSGLDDYRNQVELGVGTHSIAFIPTSASAYVRLQSRAATAVLINQCTLEGPGEMTLPTPWAEADLGLVRYDQSGDIVFCACAKTTNTIGYQQRKIERRSTRSWSVVLYQSDNGPFLPANTGPGTITPSALTGNATLTASIPTFRSTHVGALFAVTSTGQTVNKTAALLNDATNSILVEGTGTDRAFTIVLSGMTGGGRTVVLQRSFDNSTWVSVSGKSWTADTTESYTDALDNESVYYRLLLSVVGTAGNTTLTLTIATGSVRGISRITAFSSSTSVSAEILEDFGATTASDNWEEGQWSDSRGWPTSVAFYEGRLWWAGRDAVIGSASDAYYDMDAAAEGDAASINRTIGSGQVDTINWILGMQRLLLGGQGAEMSCRSTSLDEPLTPSNFNIKRPSTQGSAAVGAVVVDDTGIYVQRGGTRVYQMGFDANTYDYATQHLSAFVPEIGQPGITRIAVQRQPDTRVHFVRSDGTAAVLLFDKVENVICWLEIETGDEDDLIEDVVILPADPGEEEDQVYYVTAYSVNGSTVRYLERWALESECVGGTLNKQADSFIIFTNSSASTTVTGLTHLEGRDVVVWQDGVCPEDADGLAMTYTVSGGQITLDTAATTGIVGLPYTARWKSGKLVQLQAMLGTPLSQHKQLRSLALIACDLHPKGLRWGQDFDHLDDLPSVNEGAAVDTDTIFADFDGEPATIPGSWSTDARVCLEAAAPRPATVLALVAEVMMNE